MERYFLGHPVHATARAIATLRTYVQYVAYDSVALYIAAYPSVAGRRCSIIKCIAFLLSYLASHPPISGRVALRITALCPLRRVYIDAALSRRIQSFVDTAAIPIHKCLYTLVYFLFFQMFYTVFIFSFLVVTK